MIENARVELAIAISDHARQRFEERKPLSEADVPIEEAVGQALPISVKQACKLTGYSRGSFHRQDQFLKWRGMVFVTERVTDDKNPDRPPAYLLVTTAVSQPRIYKGMG